MMPSLKKKIIKGHIYWYAVEMARINGKPKQVWQMYLGTAEKIIELMKGSEDNPYARFKSFQYGKIAAMLKISEELKFIEIVNKHTDKKLMAGLTVGEYLLLDIIGKSSSISSENGLEEWFKNSALSILWKFPHKLSCQNFLNHMGYIDQATIKNIEIDISRILIEKGIKPSILYLDESNWFTYGDNYDNKSELLKKGFNKKHRYDKNQVGVALVTNEDNIPFMHETYAGNIHDSTEFPELIDGIVNYLTDLKINTEDITLVFDKGNNSTDNIGKLISKMSFVASAKFDQAEDLLDIPLEDFKHIYTNSKDHEIYGSRTKYTFFGKEFTTIITYNKATYTLQKESYLSSKAKILAKLTDLKRRLESDRGKERDKSSVEREISDIIIKDFRSIIGYEVSDIPKGKKKPKIKFWTRKQNETKREKSFGKLIIFTDKSEWHSKKIVQTYNNKYLVEDDFKLLNDELLVPIGPIYHRKDFNIRVHVFLAIVGLLFYRYLAWRTKRFNLTLKKLIDNLSQIRIALVLDKTSNKSDIIVEEMTSIQASLFSFLDMGKYIDVSSKQVQ
jgi:transposase